MTNAPRPELDCPTSTTVPPLRRRRAIRGASAVLLPMLEHGTPDWDAFELHLGRTIAAGLVPAVNMDTGFGPLLDPNDRDRALGITRSLCDEFIAGAHVEDAPGATLSFASAAAAVSSVADAGGLPILFPFHAMASLDDEGLVELHRALGGVVDAMLAFELGPMFHPAGRIFSTEVFAALLDVDAVVGAKHSSLRRDLEWQRLALRDEQRPDFWFMTGNDLAIDMVVYGSDYLLGLSTFAPDAFAARDAAWARGDDARFWELNDVLQYLGQFSFRPPVPAYRHDAAMFLHERGWLGRSDTHPGSPQRPDSDREVLADLATRVGGLVSRDDR